MADTHWLGHLDDIRQVNTVTPTAANAATYTLTINTKIATYLSDASATVAEITAGAVAAWNTGKGAQIGECNEITAADGTTELTLTADRVSGDSPLFTQTSSSSAGTFVTVATTAHAGRHDWAGGLNWSEGTAPGAADAVYAENSSTDIRYSLNQTGVAVGSLNVRASFTGVIGNKRINTDAGTGATQQYAEYRSTYLVLNPATVDIGRGEGNGSSMIKLNTEAVQTAITVWDTASPLEADVGGAFIWKGAHASNTMRVEKGSVAIAPYGGETAQLLTLENVDGTVLSYSGVTLTTVNQLGAAGVITIMSAIGGTLTIKKGKVIILGTGTVASFVVEEGAELDYRGSGAAGSAGATVRGKLTVDNNAVGFTVSTLTIDGNGEVSDPANKLTVTTLLRGTRTVGLKATSA